MFLVLRFVESGSMLEDLVGSSQDCSSHRVVGDMCGLLPAVKYKVLNQRKQKREWLEWGRREKVMTIDDICDTFRHY